MVFSDYLSCLSSYYNLEETTPDAVNKYLSNIVSNSIGELIGNGCVETDPMDDLQLVSTSMGRLASFYYLSHKTIGLFINSVHCDSGIEDLLHILSASIIVSLFAIKMLLLNFKLYLIIFESSKDGV